MFAKDGCSAGGGGLDDAEGAHVARAHDGGVDVRNRHEFGDIGEGDVPFDDGEAGREAGVGRALFAGLRERLRAFAPEHDEVDAGGLLSELEEGFKDGDAAPLGTKAAGVEEDFFVGGDVPAFANLAAAVGGGFEEREVRAPGDGHELVARHLETGGDVIDGVLRSRHDQFGAPHGCADHQGDEGMEFGTPEYVGTPGEEKFWNLPATCGGETVAENFLGEDEVGLEFADRTGDRERVAEVGVELPFPCVGLVESGAFFVAVEVAASDPFINFGGAFFETFLPGFDAAGTEGLDDGGAVGEIFSAAHDAGEEGDVDAAFPPFRAEFLREDAEAAANHGGTDGAVVGHGAALKGAVISGTDGEGEFLDFAVHTDVDRCRPFDEVAEQGGDGVNLGRLDGDAGGEKHDGLGKGFGFRKHEAGVGEEGFVRLHTMAAGEEVPAGEDVFGVEELDKAVAGEAAATGIDFDGDVLEVALFGFVEFEEGEAGDRGEGVAIGVIVAAVDGDELVELGEIGEAHGGGHFVHLAVGTDVDDIVVTGEAKVFHEANLGGEAVVIGDDGTAFHGVEELGGVEAEDLGLAEVADHFAAVGTAETVGGIVKNLEIVGGGDDVDGIGIAGAAPEVNADDAGGARGDHAGDLCGVDGEGVGIDVAEDGGDFLPLEGVGGGDEGEGGDDDFAFKFEGADGDFECDGSVAHGDAIFDADVIGNAFFEFADTFAGIGEPLAIEDVVDAGEEVGAIADVGAADVDRFGERLGTAEGGEVFDCEFVVHRGLHVRSLAGG